MNHRPHTQGVDHTKCNMLAVVFIIMCALIDWEALPALQMWTSVRRGRTRSCPVTTTATTTLAATTAPAALATSSTRTTGPAEVGPRGDSIHCHDMPHLPVQLEEAPRKDKIHIETIKNEVRGVLQIPCEQRYRNNAPLAWKPGFLFPMKYKRKGLTTRGHLYSWEECLPNRSCLFTYRGWKTWPRKGKTWGPQSILSEPWTKPLPAVPFSLCFW